MALTAIILTVMLMSGVLGDDNGLARTPPMGWRSWNYYHCNVNQLTMEYTFKAMVDRSRKVDGVPTSLADLGYTDVGLDDCWQKCGDYGPNHYTFHDANGIPQVDTKLFPSFSEMTKLAHSYGLTAGFYSNNCVCHDSCNSDDCFAGDVSSTLAWGFDSIKLDGCSAERNISKWRNLFNKTSPKPIMIENCHNGPNIPWGTDPASCPFHMYRSSDDIAPSFGSILNNGMTVFGLATKKLSYPGCWAYPDMLQIAMDPQGKFPGLSPIESRTHFGIWSILSSPLILGLDVTNNSAVSSAWDYIANKEVIQVNQQWAGFSGSQYYMAPTTKRYTPCNYGQNYCDIPISLFLYKPLPSNSYAVLLVNSGDANQDFRVTFTQIPGNKLIKFKVRDLWKKADVGVFSNTYTVHSVIPTDSVFLLLTPSS